MPKPTNLPISTSKVDNQHHKLNRFIKKTLHRLHNPRTETPGGSSTSSLRSVGAKTPSDIFERSLEANATSILTNTETPLHYTIENYTNPILDTTTELLNDPKVDLQSIKLNCYGEEVLSGASSPEVNASIGNNSNTNNKSFSNKLHHSDSALEFRPRSRSIISISLMSSLDHDHHEPGDNESSKEIDDNTNSSKHSPIISRLNSQREADEDSPNTIQYYSFADMIKHEDDMDDPHPITSGDFVQSSPSTPFKRKGSCHTISLKDYIGNV